MGSRVDLVGLLFLVWGAVTMLIGASTLALGVGAAALMASPGRERSGQIAAGLTAATFSGLAIIALLWGLAHIAVGLPLRRRRHWARLGAIMLSAVDLVLLPYGTALGSFALWTLLSEEGKRLFEA